MHDENQSLKPVYDTRRANLRALAALHNGPKALGKLLKVSAAYMNALAGPNPSRNITEQTARKFEQRLKLAPGWLDMTRAA